MQYDVIIIGAGPAGYVAAIRAGQTGLKTLVIDKKYVGGMCLNWGCIPTKSILESAKLYKRITKSAGEFGIVGIDPAGLSFSWPQAVKRTMGIVQKLTRGIEYLWKKNGVEYLQAEATILSPTSVKAGDKVFDTKNILIATGSKPDKQSVFPKTLELEDLFSLEKLPERPVLYGQGAIIAEFAQFFSMLGKPVTIVSSGSPLTLKLDPYMESFLVKRLKKDKVNIFPLEAISINSGSIKHGDDTVEFDSVINCSLRKAILPPMELEMKLADGFIATDEFYRSSIPTIFAAGDVNGKSYLAHAASAQALSVIDFINGVNHISSSNYPINIYSDPELAQIGSTEPELKAKGQEYEVREFGLNANGKALAEGNAEGFIRLLFEPKYHQVLGVQIAAANATDLISEATVLMELEGTVYDLARAVHAHPTIAEVFMDVARE